MLLHEDNTRSERALHEKLTLPTHQPHLQPLHAG
jgi:hypothetical protein